MTRIHSHTHTHQNKSLRPPKAAGRILSLQCGCNLQASHVDRIAERAHVFEGGRACSRVCASLWFRCSMRHMSALQLRRVRLAPNTRPADVGGRGAAVCIGFLSMALRIVSDARHTHSSQVTHHTSHNTLSPAIHRPTFTLPAGPVVRSHHTALPHSPAAQHMRCIFGVEVHPRLIQAKPQRRVHCRSAAACCGNDTSRLHELKMQNLTQIHTYVTRAPILQQHSSARDACATRVRAHVSEAIPLH